jgi:ABC-2 type transport system ATP-binding protein
MPTAIEMCDVVKTFGPVRALDGFTMQVNTGEVHGFLGPNGAGKTTTLRILAGLAQPDAGKAWIAGQEISVGDHNARSVFGFLPEEPAFYPWMTAREYLYKFAAPLYHIDPLQSKRRADELLDQVGLARAANRRIGGFSRGMRQRLGLAQALIHKPQVLLLDEPVSALDPAGRKEVLDLIEAMHGSTTILLSTHILADVERVCDVIGIIHAGQMVLQERRSELIGRYASPLIEIEVENTIDGLQDELGKVEGVETIHFSGEIFRILVVDPWQVQAGLMELILNRGVKVRRFELVRPNLEDIFLRLTQEPPVLAEE